MQKILVVDDDADIRRLVSMRLRAAQFEVVTAEDGEAGLNLVRTEHPRVVLLDLMMPRMHGYTVCQEIRKDPALHGTKVIITSAKSYPVDIKKAKEVGADDYVTKPYDLEELVGKIRKILEEAGTPVLVKFWGTRGSIPTPGPATQRYGGNTSCVELRWGDNIVALDCGTGIRELGLALAREFRGRNLDLHVFVGHTHWDHIQGFPFFVPAYVPGNHLTIYSLHGSDKSLEKVFTGQMDASYFPVSLSDMMARLHFAELEGVLTIGGAKISHWYLNHPGLAIGFRFEWGNKSLVYLADHEPYWRMSGDNEYNRKLDREIDDFARNADLYIREAQYTDEEYPSKRGWGHSTWSDALESAHEAKAKALALYHHDPMHDDEIMDRIVEQCQVRMREREMDFLCFAASDNLQMTL